MDKSFITGYTVIKNNSLKTDSGEQFIYDNNASFSDFIKAVYQYQRIEYPKFYKMDNLCKLAFIAAEILINRTKLKERYSDDEVGIVLCNASSSIDSDSKHVESFSDKSNYYPSPSIFVYTLPNIAIGEICIRNAIRGENALFILEEFDEQFLVDYLQSLLNSKKIEGCIGGWIEYSEMGYEAFLFTAENEYKLERKHEYIPFSKEEIRRIYSNY